MNEHDEKIIGEEVPEAKEDPKIEPAEEASPETNTAPTEEQNAEPAPEITPAPPAAVKEYWSFSEQV